MNVLITGVSGFVGKSLVDYFSTRLDVTLFGHGRKPSELKRKFFGQRITILDDFDSSEIDQQKIDCIIHTAGIAHDLSNSYVPEDYFRVNTDGTKLAFSTFVNSKAKHFVFLSSVKAAVDSYPGLLTENVQPSPKTPYGESKLRAEQFINQYLLPDGKQSFVLRPCMIHGPGNKGNLNLLYKFVKTGIPYPLGAFDNQRSFLSIENFCFVIDHILKGNVPAGTYNLADNGFISTKNLYALIANVSGKKERVLNLPAKGITVLARLLRKTSTLRKLTENMMVSNAKILKHVPGSLAISLEGGLTKTIQSFRGE